MLFRRTIMIDQKLNTINDNYGATIKETSDNRDGSL